MKQVFISSVLSALFITNTPGYAQVVFEKWYGGPYSDVGSSVVQTADGGYIITGSTTSYGAGALDVYLVKTDSLGDTLWTAVYGGTYDDYGQTVFQTADGGYLVGGTTASFSGGSNDAFLLRTDSVGNTQWRKVYGGTGEDWGNAMCQARDGGYILAGSTTSYGGCLVYCIRTDVDGNVIWQDTYDTGGAWNDGFGVASTSDSGCIITGAVDWGPIVDDVLLIKIEYDGTQEWMRTFGAALYTEEGYSVVQTYDGGYVVTGMGNDGDIYLIRTNSAGQVAWSHFYGGAYGDVGRSVMQSQDSCYVITGQTGAYGVTTSDVCLMKVNDDGNVVWTRSLGGAEWDIGASVTQTTDGGYIICGTSGRFEDADVYLIKTDENGQVGLREEEMNVSCTVLDLKLCASPNPFRDKTLISYSISAPYRIAVRIYDVSGRCVRLLQDAWMDVGSHGLIWDGRDNTNHMVSAGVYYVEVESTGNSRRVGKIVYMDK